MADRERRASKEPTLEELEQGLAINEHKLETECSRHADVFYRVAKRVALETSKRDALKQLMAETEATVDLDYRRVAEKASEKPREKAIESECLLDARVKRIKGEYLEASRLVLEWTALKEAFQARSYELSHLVDLYVRNYYGEISKSEADLARQEMTRMRQQRGETRKSNHS
jgi:hypothetical protein